MFAMCGHELGNLANKLAKPPAQKTWQTGKLIFFSTQVPLRQWIAYENEFANLGKLTWQSGKLNGHLGAVKGPICFAGALRVRRPSWRRLRAGRPANSPSTPAANTWPA